MLLIRRKLTKFVNVEENGAHAPINNFNFSSINVGSIEYHVFNDIK